MLDQANSPSLLQLPMSRLRKRRSSKLDTEGLAENQNSPRKSPQLCSELDTDLLLSLKRERQYKEDEAKQEGRRVKRSAVRCCECEIEILSSRCSCRHEFCPACFYYNEHPLPPPYSPLPNDYNSGDIADAEYDDFWKETREILKSKREERKSSSLVP